MSEIDQKYYEYDVDLDDREKDSDSDRIDPSIDDLSMGGFDLIEDIAMQLDDQIVKTANSFIGKDDELKEVLNLTKHNNYVQNFELVNNLNDFRDFVQEWTSEPDPCAMIEPCHSLL